MNSAIKLIAPRRRRFSFSLRTMFVLLTLSLAFLAREVNNWRQYQRDVQTLTEAGATLVLASRPPDTLTWLLPRGSGDAVCAIQFSEPGRCQPVVHLAEELGCVSPLTDLELYYFLHSSGRIPAKGRVSEEAMAAILRCAEVQSLSFCGMSIDDKQLLGISGLANLRFLDLRGCSVTPATARRLRDMRSLQGILSENPAVQYERETDPDAARQLAES